MPRWWQMPSGLTASSARALPRKLFFSVPAARRRGAYGDRHGQANGAAVGGLPVAAFFAAQTMSAATFRDTLIACFTLLDLWTLPVMA